VVPLADEPLIEELPVEPEVLGDVLLDAEPALVSLALPVVPEVLPEAEPIIALVSVKAPVEPCRQPVSVMVFDELMLLWSDAVPDVPAVLPV
jgi:hypothetical protein